MSENLPLVRDALASVVEAVADEFRAAQSQPTSRFRFFNGRCVTRTGTSALWAWEFDGDVSLQPDAEGELLLPGYEPARATVISVDDFEVLLSTQSDLGDSARSADFVAQPLFILRALQERLTDAGQRMFDSTMLEQLLDLTEIPDPEFDDGEPRPSEPRDEYPSDPDETDPPPADLSYEQLLAAEHATQDGLRFVWGPPGTGKTATLAAAVSALAWSDRKVMIVAHSNVAVDVAMARIAEQLADSTLVSEARVLRVGTPHLPELVRHPEVLPSAIVLRQYPDMAEGLRTLEAERRRLGALMLTAPDKAPVLRQLEDVRRQLNALSHQIAAQENELVRNASVVGCTLAKAVLDGVLWSWPKDALVVDEASMAGLPYLMALATEAPRTMACFGDFRQLPPVVVSRSAAATSWLGRDVFELAGVVERIEAGEHDPRLAVLRTQYRMGEVIAEGVSRVAYFSLLSSHVDAIARAHQLSDLAPEPGCEVVIVDTSDLDAYAEKEAGPQAYSRFNLRSAALAAGLAEATAAVGRSVAVMSPYRAQVAVVHALVNGLRDVSAATMHKFQGSERDVVVVDLVDANPLNGPSRLTGKDRDLTLRLLNVGISRARGKLILLADLEFIRSTSAQDSPAVLFLDTFLELGAKVVAGTDLLPSSAGKSVSWRPNWWTAVDELLAGSEIERVTMGLPSRIEFDATLEERLDHLRGRLSRLTLHVPMTTGAALDGKGYDLRLRRIAASPLAIVPGRGLAVGGAHLDSPVALLRGDAIGATVRRLLDLEN